MTDTIRESHRASKKSRSGKLSKEDIAEQRRLFEESFKDPRCYRDRRQDDHHSLTPTPDCRRKYRRRATFDRNGDTWWLKRRYSGHFLH